MAREVGRATECTKLETESNRETGVEISEDRKSVQLFAINQWIVLAQPAVSNNSRDFGIQWSGEGAHWRTSSGARGMVTS